MTGFISELLAGIKPEDIVELNLDSAALENMLDEKLTDLSPLHPLIKLEKLVASGHALHRIEGIEALRSLKVLSLARNNIQTLGGMDTLIYLEKLDMSYNELRSVSGLESLQRLNYLDLSYNQLEKIDGIGQLINLKTLHMSGNPRVRSLSSLISLFGLEELHLEEIPVRDWHAVSALTQLQSICLSTDDPASLAPLADLPHLRELEISLFHQYNLDELPVFSFVTDLTITHCPQLERAGRVKQFPELKRLNLAHNNIKDISFVEGMYSLEALDLRGNPVAQQIEPERVSHIPLVRY